MKISYNKLWKLLIDRGLRKKDLKERISLSSVSMAKLSKNEPVTMNILLRICEELNCDICDIVQFEK